MGSKKVGACEELHHGATTPGVVEGRGAVQVVMCTWHMSAGGRFEPATS